MHVFARARCKDFALPTPQKHFVLSWYILSSHKSNDAVQLQSSKRYQITFMKSAVSSIERWLASWLKNHSHKQWKTLTWPERSHWSTSAMYTSFCLCCNAFWVLAVQLALDTKRRRFWFSKFLLVWSRWDAAVCELYLECLGWVNAVYDCQSTCGGHNSSK